MSQSLRRAAMALLLASVAGGASVSTAMAANYPPARYTPDAVLPSTLADVHRGYISADDAPVLHIKSGQTVKIDTISHGGLQSATDDPVAYFARDGIVAKDVLPDAVAVWKASPKQASFGGHVLTGPIYIDGAQPGDMLEVRILKVEPRVNYGVNNVGPSGVAPHVLDKADAKTIKYDPKRGRMLFAPGIEPEMRPFMGIMAVAPAAGRAPSGPPDTFGGNLDFRRLTAGATLYLPVFVKGALFVTGDSHAGQGDGEVSGNANEASMSPTLQFIVHKGEGKALHYPWAEDAQNYYVLGMDPDLGKAAESAVTETIHWLHDRKGLSLSDAYHLSSVGVDFSIAQAVDHNLIIYGAIPKAMFADKTPYWTTPNKPAAKSSPH